MRSWKTGRGSIPCRASGTKASEHWIPERSKYGVSAARRGFALFDADARIAFMNERYQGLLGLSASVIGLTLAEACRQMSTGDGDACDVALRGLEYLLLSQNKRGASLMQRLADGTMLQIDHEHLGPNGFLHILTEFKKESLHPDPGADGVDMAAELDCALREKQFELVYQPMLSVAPLRIAGFEALLRWRHPTRGMIAPLEFIPAAEQAGKIGAIGAWALEEACVQAASWPAQVSVAVNLSPAQLENDSFIDIVTAALTKSGLHPRRLELEITEGLLLEDSQHMLSLLRALRAMGLRIAIDDFGAGYSSFGYLRKFRFDKVKIDRMFVQDAGERNDCLVILRAVTGMCLKLGIEVTAEGIETIEQMSVAIAQKCDQMQGFLFSAPRSPEEIKSLLATAVGSPEAPEAVALG